MVMQIQAGQTVRATPATIPKSFFAAAPISEAPGERERERENIQHTLPYTLAA